MIDFSQPFSAISANFAAEAIPTDKPGFYDHNNFVVLERQNPAILNNYARFVQGRAYDPVYLDRARKEIPVIAEAFYEEVAQCGRLGACVDASMILSRILEAEGFWNFCVKGAIRIDLPPESGIGPQCFWAVDRGKFAAGHAWVFAPPFHVVDVTLKLQPYNRGEERFLPSYVVSESSPIVAAHPTDILAPFVIADLRSKGVRDAEWLGAINASLPKFLSTFPAFSVLRNRTEIRYVSVAVTAGDAPLERVTNMSFRGRSAVEVYRNTIKPRLKKLRAS